MLTPYGKREWLIILLVGLAATVGCILAGWWIAAVVVAAAALALLSFFRDPERAIPSQRGQMVSPADGRVTSIHQVEHFEPFDGPALCIRIFLSVANVHVNRSPCHGRVAALVHKPGQYLNALRAESAELNESLLMVLDHPARQVPIAAVRQVAGAIARRIVCGAVVGDILQRGQRYGMIKLGSTTELYLPSPQQVTVQVREGQRVYGGSTVLAIAASSRPDLSTPSPSAQQADPDPDEA